MTTTVDGTGHAGEVSPLCPVAHGDAVEWFKYLQENAPVYLDDDGRYVVTRYADVYEALRHEPDVWSSLHDLTTADHPLANNRWIPYSDDPDHNEIRRLVNRGWTPTAVAELEPSLRANAREVLAEVEADREFDMNPVGYDFIVRSYADALGLPRDQRARLDAWTTATLMFARPREQRAPAPREQPQDSPVGPEFEGAYRDMEAYFSGLVDQHRDHAPAYCKDVEQLAPFARAIVKSLKDDPDAMTTFLQRVYPPLHLGGVSTVTHIFTNLTQVLIEHPHAWTVIREDPSLLATDKPSEAIEEILRLRSVHAGLHKRPTADVELHGTHIPKGSMVQFYYVAADHDAAVFEEPEEFRLRGITRHLAFGFGTHTCMGQSFVRLAMKVFIAALQEKFDHLEFGSEPADWSFTGTYYTPPKMLVVGRA